MSEIVERLRATGTERQRTTAHDDPTHYLHVVAKISNADGLLMAEAADEITRLEARVHHLHERLEIDPEHPYDGIDCRDETIRQQDLRVARLEARVKQLEGAGSALIADVRRRYPGEELRCQYMRALDAALNPSQEPS